MKKSKILGAILFLLILSSCGSDDKHNHGSSNLCDKEVSCVEYGEDFEKKSQAHKENILKFETQIQESQIKSKSLADQLEDLKAEKAKMESSAGWNVAELNRLEVEVTEVEFALDQESFQRKVFKKELDLESARLLLLATRPLGVKKQIDQAEKDVKQAEVQLAKMKHESPLSISKRLSPSANYFNQIDEHETNINKLKNEISDLGRRTGPTRGAQKTNQAELKKLRADLKVKEENLRATYTIYIDSVIEILTETYPSPVVDLYRDILATKNKIKQLNHPGRHNVGISRLKQEEHLRSLQKTQDAQIAEYNKLISRDGAPKLTAELLPEVPVMTIQQIQAERKKMNQLVMAFNSSIVSCEQSSFCKKDRLVQAKKEVEKRSPVIDFFEYTVNVDQKEVDQASLTEKISSLQESEDNSAAAIKKVRGEISSKKNRVRRLTIHLSSNGRNNPRTGTKMTEEMIRENISKLQTEISGLEAKKTQLEVAKNSVTIERNIYETRQRIFFLEKELASYGIGYFPTKSFRELQLRKAKEKLANLNKSRK